MSDKILIVINNLAFGGAERLVVDQINELLRRGVEVELLTLVATVKPGFVDKLNLPINCQSHLELNFNRLSNFVQLIKFLKKRKDFTVITHLFLANTLVRLAFLFIWPRPKLIIYEHNVYSKEKGWRHLLADKFFSFFTYRIIAVSAEVRDFWQKWVSPGKVRLVENGIATDFLNQLPPSDDTRQQLGVSASDLVVVSVGNVTPQKGYELFLSLAPVLTAKYSNLYFFICGRAEGEYADKLQRQFTQAGLTDRVQFLGSRSDALAIIAAADIFFMPSWWEGLSISLLEAMALGRCIVTTDIPSMRPVIKDPGIGLVFPPGDNKAAENILNTLLANQAKRVKYGKRARVASSQYSISQNIDHLLAAIA